MPSRKPLSILERITRVISESHDFRETVDRVVALVRKEMHTDVCSLYLFDEEVGRLVLKASSGLSPEAVGQVEMRPTEGLTGMVFETVAPLVVQDASHHPRYKYFPITREERFHTFLGVPIITRRKPIGVLVVQDREERTYSPEEVQLFVTIAGQIAGVILNARLLQELSTKGSKGVADMIAPARPTVIHGLAATSGIAMGRAYLLEVTEDSHYFVEEKSRDPDRERERFVQAVEQARRQVDAIQRRVLEQMGEDNAAIFTIHLMMLEDQAFLDKVRELLREGYSAVFAVRTVIAGYHKTFGAIDDPYLKERVVDIEDVGRRIIRNLTGEAQGETLKMEEEGILVTRLLTPSDTASLSNQHLMGVLTATGSLTSHAIILARSLGIPCVTGIEDVMEVVHPGDFLILDGNSGNVFINPEDSVIREYRRLLDEYNRRMVELVGEKDLPAVTLDGFRVHLLANVGLLSDLKLVQFYGAEGIGLYRTEFPFMARNTLPGEEDQYRIYRKMIEGAEGRTVTIRTLDTGGDKDIPSLDFPREENPFLGWRSVRMCLARPDLFGTQLRAILRAARHGAVQLLVPMISSLEELREVKALFEKAKEELRQAGAAFSDQVPLGIMVEVPSAAFLARKLARECEFLSVGTNDLTQYTLAVDRNNKRVAHLFDPLNPAIIQLINLSAQAAREGGIPIAVCGEIASDPLWAPLLVGLGIDELSMNAASIPLVKRAVRSMEKAKAERAARLALRAGTSDEVRKILNRAGF